MSRGVANDVVVEDNDVASVVSANTDEQLSFWSLTLSFMLKLIALSIILFVLPYNEWIVLHDTPAIAAIDEEDNARRFMRGVSGSDCVRESIRDSPIDCARWRETLDGSRDDFWTLRLIVPSNIEFPSMAYRAIFYVLLVQLALHVLDMGTTLAMCCRYRVTQKRLEKQFAMLCYICITFCYIYIIATAVGSRRDFLHSDPPFKAWLGNAFCLYAAVTLVYNMASCLIFYTECYRPAAIADTSKTMSVSRHVRVQLRDLLPNASQTSKYMPASTKAHPTAAI